MNMKTVSDHPSVDLLERSLFSRTTDQEQREVEEHLLICDACRLRLNALEEEIEVMRQVLKFEE